MRVLLCRSVRAWPHPGGVGRAGTHTVRPQCRWDTWSWACSCCRLFSFVVSCVQFSDEHVIDRAGRITYLAFLFAAGESAVSVLLPAARSVLRDAAAHIASRRVAWACFACGRLHGCPLGHARQRGHQLGREVVPGTLPTARRIWHEELRAHEPAAASVSSAPGADPSITQPRCCRWSDRGQQLARARPPHHRCEAHRR